MSTLQHFWFPKLKSVEKLVSLLKKVACKQRPDDLKELRVRHPSPIFQPPHIMFYITQCWERKEEGLLQNLEKRREAQDLLRVNSMLSGRMLGLIWEINSSMENREMYCFLFGSFQSDFMPIENSKSSFFYYDTI